MSEASLDARSGPATDAQLAAAMVRSAVSPDAHNRGILAQHLRTLALQVEAGEAPFTRAAIVLYRGDDRSVQVQHAGPTPGDPLRIENDMLAALQRAITRWSLPIE